MGRRFNVDPKPNLSSSNYSCFANNPISIIDPNGTDTAFADDKSSKAFLNAKQNVDNMIISLKETIKTDEEKLKNDGWFWGKRRLKRTVGDNKERLIGLQEIADHFTTICSPETQKVTYSVGPTMSRSGGVTTYRPGEGLYVIINPEPDNLTSVFVHENRHVIGYMIGEIGITGAYDFMDEYVAYSQAFLINADEVRTFIREAAQDMYPDAGIEQQSVTLMDAIEYRYSGRNGITNSRTQIMAEEKDRIPLKERKR